MAVALKKLNVGTVISQGRVWLYGAYATLREWLQSNTLLLGE